MNRPKSKATALSKKRVLGVALCLLAVSAAQNQAGPFLFDLAQPKSRDTTAPVVGRSFDNPVGDLQGPRAPLEMHPARLGAFETANMFPAGALSYYVGTIQTDPSKGSGTGNQLYFGGGSYAVTERLSFGIDLSSYEDPPVNPINGAFPDFVVNTVAIWGKYGVYSNDRFSIAALASVENFVRLEYPGIVGRESGILIGALKLPITYAASPRLKFHLTPGVTFLPEDINGVPFYGTTATLGGGVSYKPNDRLALYGAVDVSLGPGSNTITNTASFVNKPVWTVGGRYNVTPKIALDAYVTNGVGSTPATSILTHWPDGNLILGGVQLTYTPGARYQNTYRGRPTPVTARQSSLQQNGFTLGSADVIEPGEFSTKGWYGTNDSYGLAFAYGIDRDMEFGLVLENYSQDGTADPILIPKTYDRFMLGPKLRFLDQTNGDPFSLSASLMYGRQLTPFLQGTGVFYLEADASYQISERLSVKASPQVAAFGKTEIVGLGGGINYELFDGLELIAEATMVGADANDPTYAVGVRYNLPDSRLSIDAHASNAIGQNGIGTMIAQDSTKFSISLTKRFNLFN